LEKKQLNYYSKLFLFRNDVIRCVTKRFWDCTGDMYGPPARVCTGRQYRPLVLGLQGGRPWFLVLAPGSLSLATPKPAREILVKVI